MTARAPLDLRRPIGQTAQGDPIRPSREFQDWLTRLVSDLEAGDVAIAATAANTAYADAEGRETSRAATTYANSPSEATGTAYSASPAPLRASTTY